MRSPRRPTAFFAALALAVGVAACGGDDGEVTDVTVDTTEAPVDDGTDGTTAVDGAGGTEGTDPEGTDGPDEGDDDGGEGSEPPTGDLPGEQVDLPPHEGTTQSVVGVEVGDTLNVRAGPGADREVVVELDPLDGSGVATGHNRTLDDGSTWAEITAGDDVGWVNAAFLAEAGATTDVTDEVEVSAEGASPSDIARDVADQRSPGEPAPTVTVAAADDGVGVVDVIGIGDDAAKGERITVTVEGDDVTVEVTVWCARGVTGDGLCV